MQPYAAHRYYCIHFSALQHTRRIIQTFDPSRPSSGSGIKNQFPQSRVNGPDIFPTSHQEACSNEICRSHRRHFEGLSKACTLVRYRTRMEDLALQLGLDWSFGFPNHPQQVLSIDSSILFQSVKKAPINGPRNYRMSTRDNCVGRSHYMSTVTLECDV